MIFSGLLFFDHVLSLWDEKYAYGLGLVGLKFVGLGLGLKSIINSS